jgi:FtsP/CotA-like multicopper oxidase with cupredoxin domain
MDNPMKESMMSSSSLGTNRRVFLKIGAASIVTAASSFARSQEQRQSSSGESVDETPDVHEFDFTAKAFSAQPDGRTKELWGYNGQFPGPEIRVQEGDLIRVTVNNQLPVPTSIHWHGMKQRDNWRMDGVTPVSRPPIESGDSFTYEFKAEPAGTHWYHSHTGLQYSEGLHGPLIIESKTNDYDYDREEVLMIGDWFVEKSDDIYEKIKSGEYRKAEKPSKGPTKPDYGDVSFESFVFNGQGQLPDGSKGGLNTFVVEKGETIRFRIINTSSTYALKLQFDQHPMTIIENDGQPVKPVKTDGITIDIGERFDVLVKANRSGKHYIRAATMDGQSGLALMQYKDSPVSEPPKDADWGPTISAASLVAPQPVNLPAAGHRTVELNFSGSMKPYAWMINGKEFPDGPPVKVREGESIRFVMKNPTMMAHPFHLHGHYFRLLGRPGELNLLNPPLKDSVTVPAQDEMVIQFDADNPGKWFFHCHIEWHLGIGMALVVEYPDL